ncbi:hypothetical protein PMIN06_000285 [Paraphaeosphaeria minitans]|uniref:Fungal specific transcription factor n=1 Tax=Paraphaeosphaeria minitans TaxID=565426 RepID=A0A9P6GS59_9PLEO|nr:fungal specific transcription factor [Paraphaeosphaeria minitans]
MTADAAAPPLRSAPSPPRHPAAPHLPLPLPSPTMHAATSPSTLHPSPSSTPHPASFPNGGTRHVRPNDAPKARARLACYHCRKSKVRCGPTTGDIVRPCPQCVKGGKTCLWPDDNNPSPNPAVKRTDHPAARDPSPDHRPSESRKRKKPPITSFEKLSMADGDLIDPNRIDDAMWDDLYTIFRHHFATELPFLHEISFLRDVKLKDNHKHAPRFDALRLAFLALTVPFYEGFRRQSFHDSLQAARKYAEAAERHINFYALSSPSIEIPQALLMLSLRAHGEGQGSRSFIMLSMAVKTMQLLNCQFDHELVDKEIDDKKRSSTKQAARDESGQRFVLEEIRRRTFWSCFIVDRYISSGDYKTRNISLEDPLVLVQLPCSEDNFDIGTKTKTRKLRESDQDFKRREKKFVHNHPEDANVAWEDEDKQSPLVWFIKALDLFGDVMRYTCTVTRRAEHKWPWHQDSEHFRLDQRVDDLTSRLPAVLKLTPTVRDVAMSPPYRRRATPYILLHSTLLMCKIALHREYLPYITHPKSTPQGPTDGPNCEALQKACEREDPDFFVDSARTFFNATKNGLDLFTSSKKAGTLVESPLTAFVSHAVTFNIMWLAFFPNFDQDGVLCQGRGRPDNLVVNNFKDAFAILHDLQGRLILARAFGKRLKNLFSDLLKCKTLYNNPESPTEMKVSHGLKAYLEMENDHKEFGDEITETDNVAFEEAPDVGILLRVYQTENSTDGHYSPVATKSEVKNETGTLVERAPEPRSAAAASSTFTSVNQGYGVSNHASTPHQHYSSSYQQPYQSADRPSSIGAAPEFQPYRATYNHAPASREPITPSTVETHPGETASVNNSLEFYPELPNNGDYTQGHVLVTDIGSWTANTFLPAMDEYSAPQPMYWPTWGGAGQGS